MDKYIGRLLDNRYEILDIIGNGGMAVVYKARCHRLNRLVAIKILRDDYSQDAEFRRRFHAESQAVAMLNHPNIVSVYDVSTNGDADYIVMELVDGITLKQYMERRGGLLNWKESLHFAMQIAKALEHAHNQGIVHRDIKPHNIMILKNGTAKVTDFGIAQIMSSQNTLTKEALGSVHYISPEQAKGGRVDNRSDLYSLGVVMYEMLTGQPPYDGESPVAVALKHINGGAVRPSTLNPNIPGGLEQIILKAMSIDPAQRYASATEMLYDMEEVRKNPDKLFYYDGRMPEPKPAAPRPQPRTTAEKVAGVRPEAPVRPVQSRPAPRPRPEPEEEEEPPRRNKGMTIAISICGALAAVAVIVLVLMLTLGDKGPTMVQVPNFVGEIFSELKPSRYPNLVLVDDEYVFDDTVPEGEILLQEPRAYEKVEVGTEIRLTISNGPETEQMMDLVNRSEENARKSLDSLKNLNLVILVEQEYNDELEAGRVIRTDPEVGSTLTKGQTVTLWVSKGPHTMVMPDVTDEPQTNAEAILNDLEDMNLEIRIQQESSEEIEKGHVVRTEPSKGQTIRAGQKITLYVSSGSAVVMTKVPQVVGMDISKASSLLRDQNLKCDYDLVESDEPKDVVLTQSIEKGKEVPEGTVVLLTVSKGPAETEPPETTEPITEPTETTGPQITQKIVTLDLPKDLTSPYKIQVFKDQAPVADEFLVEVGTTEVSLSLEGTGTQYFDFYVNGAYVDSFKVDFASPNQERISIAFTIAG